MLGLSTTFACGAAAVSSIETADVHPLTDDGGPPDAAPDGNKYPACPHGALEDPHRGFIRCLAPGEKSPFAPVESDAGADSAPADSGSSDSGSSDSGSSDSGTPDSGTPDSGTPDSGTPDSGSSDAGPEPVRPGPVPVVEMKAPKFENGDVPNAEKNLSGKKVLDGIAKCVSDAGGLTAKTGTLKVELLVRVRGKAEGVEVTPTGVPEAGAKCVRNFLKNRTVGVPSADPVGVTVIYQLKPASK
ncbi:MAG: hypothetical protein IPK82_12620 [Polyangiaceae bacterium]|nr:hypothetical protein [Polyangiaceae bacterium]